MTSEQLSWNDCSTNYQIYTCLTLSSSHIRGAKMLHWSPGGVWKSKVLFWGYIQGYSIFWLAPGPWPCLTWWRWTHTRWWTAMWPTMTRRLSSELSADKYISRGSGYYVTLGLTTENTRLGMRRGPMTGSAPRFLMEAGSRKTAFARWQGVFISAVIQNTFSF